MDARCRHLAVQRCIPWCIAPNQLAPINEAASHDCGHTWRRKNFRGCSSFYSDVATRVTPFIDIRRHVCKNGWRAALLFITVAPDKNRIAIITNMLKVTGLGQRLCSSSTCTVHVEGHQLDTIILCVRALDQPSRNCDGSHDAKAASQNRRGSSRSQPLRNGICICRRCREGLHTEGSHKK